MKAIAFAIIIASYFNIGKERFEHLDELSKNTHAILLILCCVGFWFCIFFESIK